MTTIPADQVSDTQLSRYAQLIYDVTGIRISPQKKALLSNRLRRRLKITGIESYEKYFKHLHNLHADAPEWDAFLQEITTHETFLFRDESHWKWFQGSYLPNLALEAARGDRRRTLRIWSAACSTGDEAHTVACCIVNTLPNCSAWKIEIVGTDIGVGAVKHAREGEFNERAMRLVPDQMRTRYFSPVPGTRNSKAKPILTELITFRQHNLLEPLRETPFDLVFLKNVLIYFDRNSKIRVLENVSKVLPGGGLLLAGAAEGISDLLPDYDRVEPWLFRKP